MGSEVMVQSIKEKKLRLVSVFRDFLFRRNPLGISWS